MTIRFVAAASLALTLIALTGCAGEQAPAPQAVEASEMLFISPMGEPFRAKSPAPYPSAAWFKGADANHDGKLDRAEFVADADRFFKVLDLNHDGVIDHREIYAYEHKLVPEILGVSAGALRQDAFLHLAAYGQDETTTTRPSGPSVSGGGAAPYNFLAEPEPVQSADIRLSGLITLDDFRTRARQRFDFLDEKKAGYLTLEGLPRTQVQPEPDRRDRKRA